MDLNINHSIPNQFLIKIKDFTITIKREDLIDNYCSGNKIRKLKYNFLNLKKNGFNKIVTFGGAFSNHLYATSLMGNINNIPTVGFVRGDELLNQDKNPTLKFCEQNGMKLKFLDRGSYRLKEKSEIVSMYLKEKSKSYLIPEGGTNSLAIMGCKEIINKVDRKYDSICCPVGTGGTILGLIESSFKDQFIVGFPVSKNKNLITFIRNNTSKKNWIFQNDYSFGGYGKVSSDLIEFINKISINHKILFDPIYNGKMLFGIFDLIKKNKWKWGKNILVIHTGGQQGIYGLNQFLKRKKLKQIIIPDF